MGRSSQWEVKYVGICKYPFPFLMKHHDLVMESLHVTVMVSLLGVESVSNIGPNFSEV